MLCIGSAQVYRVSVSPILALLPGLRRIYNPFITPVAIHVRHSHSLRTRSLYSSFPGHHGRTVSRVSLCIFKHHVRYLFVALYITSFTSSPQVTMLAAPQDASPRKRSISHSTDDHSTKDRSRKLFQRYAHDLTMSSQSLAISTSGPHHDDLPTPSAPTLALHTSAHSTPMTSPSTAYSSLFPGSLSSATSESAPSAEYRSEFGLLMSGSSAYSPAHGSTSSRSSQPVSPRSQSITESDTQPSQPRMPCKSPSLASSHRQSTPPHSPLPQTPGIAADAPAEHHTRSHSKLTTSIKNFLSRPAIPSPSRFSFNSSTTPSVSETSFRSFQIPAAVGKWSMTPRKPHPPNLEISGSSVVVAAMPSSSRDSTPPTDVHRRYASEAAAKIYHARTGNGHPTSQENLDLPVQNVPPVLAHTREPKTRNVLRRRPSGSAKLFKARERGTNSPARPHGIDADPPPKAGTSRLIEAPFPLTPAGAVVEAYKQQELHRDDMPSPPILSIDDRMNPRASHDGGYGREHPEKSPTPYYTVFGSSSRVKAGSPDDRWDKLETDQLTWNTSRPTPLHQPSASDPSGCSLTRRVSNKWRQVKAGTVTSEESPAHDHREHSKGRPSLQEIRASDKSGTRSTGRSMDGAPNMGDGVWSSPILGHARSGSDKDGRKIWRLMRRISTGGLRDRFQSGNVVPPVPAIPKELLQKVDQGERSNEPVSMPRHQPSSSLHDKERTPPFKNILTTPPSAVIASSSSNSTDITSTQCCQKTHSARSSVSSYGEAVVTSRSPEIALDQRIIALDEQLRLGEGHTGSGKACTSSMPVPRSPRRSVSVPAGLRTAEDTEGEHVPLPSPHRQTCSGDSSSCAPSSPSSTSAPASGSGVRQSRTVDGIVSLSPPPRSTRHSTRGGSTASSPSHSVLVKQVDVGGGTGVVAARQLDRMPSGQSDMTARAASPEPGRSRDQDASSHTRTGLTFRELGAPRRPPLTEREKLDIWNDLLDRSDKAGGTLHINSAAELMSDNLRFSMHSEI